MESHTDKGWEKFTDAVVRCVSEKAEHAVFILWGNYAKNKINKAQGDGEKIIKNEKRHEIIEGTHPSRLAEENAIENDLTRFRDVDYFKPANAFLKENKITEIDWCNLHLYSNSEQATKENEGTEASDTEIALRDPFDQLRISEQPGLGGT